MPQSASRRHREKINATLEELGGLLPLPEESRSKLDKLTVLKLSVSFFQTQNYLQSGKSILISNHIHIVKVIKSSSKFIKSMFDTKPNAFCCTYHLFS